MFDQVQALVDEYLDLEQQLADPAVHADQSKARSLGRRYAALGPIVSAYQRWKSLSEDAVAARELASEDSAFADEAQRIDVERAAVGEQLTELLLPRDPDDDGASKQGSRVRRRNPGRREWNVLSMVVG